MQNEKDNTQLKKIIIQIYKQNKKIVDDSVSLKKETKRLLFIIILLLVLSLIVNLWT